MNENSSAAATMEEVNTLSTELKGLFTIHSYTIDKPAEGNITFSGSFICDLDKCFDELRQRFEQLGFTPMVREQDGQIVLIAMPMVFDPKPSNWRTNLALVVLTIFSTLLVAAAAEIANEVEGDLGAFELYWLSVQNLWRGIPYSASIMLILGAHELGHYFAARHHKVPVTLPYFIPFPIPPIGTMGAFIRIKAPVKNRRALFDVGAAGPLAGLVVAIPILLIGLATSPVEPYPDDGYMVEGNSVLYWTAKLVVKGQVLPAESEDVFMNQMAWAGWVGLFVTGLNLIPVGQLDGGHVAYTLLGRRARRFFLPVMVGLIALVILTQTLTWAIWIFLLFFLGRIYAEPLDDVTPLDNRRRWLAIFTLLLFILVFVPIPLSIVAP
jgi:membrane-associated protease RseP (regulator of RpoE activity)